LALLNEIISVLILNTGHVVSTNNNIYVLLESILFLLQFKNWGSFVSKKYLFWLIFITLVGIWITENFIIGKISQTYPYFRIVYSFTFVLLAIGQINKIIIRDRRNILINPIFLICIGIIFYYTYKVLIETFWAYGLTKSRDFIKHVYIIHAWINLFSNLIYAFAVLWMQKRQRFLLPS
jgi:hypothetical protein